MEQTSWFDWGMEKDPIFIELQKLSHQPAVYISPFTITKNPYGLYEMESPDTHDCRSTIEKCYQYICENSK